MPMLLAALSPDSPRLECHDVAPSADSHPTHLTFTSLRSSRQEAGPTSRFTPVGSPSATRCTNAMLSRSQRANLNQENPQHTHRPATGIITKTPARPSNAAPGQGMLGAGPVLTARHTNKVLAAKDRNGGVGGGLGVSFGPAATNKLLVFDASCKPGPPVTVQRVRGSALSPKAVQPVQPVLPDHLRTPSPGVHRYASLSFSPEIVFDSEPDASHETLEEVDLDQDVELAGASARNYDEEFEPGFFISNYADSNLGDVMRGIELGTINADYEALAAQDEADRTAFKATLEIGCDNMDQNADFPNHAIFPMPIQRKAFSVKSTNMLPPVSTKQPIRFVQAAASKPSGRPASATAQPPRTTGVAGDPSSPWPNRNTRTSNDTAMSHLASTRQALGAKLAETSRTRPASVASKSSTGRPASRLVPNKTDARDSSLPVSSTTSSSAFSLLPSGVRRASNRSVSSFRTLPSNGPASLAAAPAAALDDAEEALEAFGIVETQLDVFEDEQDLGVDDALSFRLDLDG
ncbi:hypothetical protein MVLG_03573 [Microbotryum lychnidis-dioicae p1A1 Lamole]|uniref:Uncharacterized protein n=1 Tax=Microbotryum lychnidis-dioicae (strain p1A1 Lamole / MvSl-1064) TaxID=683840 RepID=U5H8L6_USTV1|nr:hypothetical protein MVLG_03573 [Microbotryum lychnidis-dioicae p1A1 Lamole]|eukprot:KDE06158.1 hypothetical protein MVLG_03573 [Microbotryum lychnidis-dioicae p1A1 Lamole]